MSWVIDAFRIGSVLSNDGQKRAFSSHRALVSGRSVSEYAVVVTVARGDSVDG